MLGNDPVCPAWYCEIEQAHQNQVNRGYPREILHWRQTIAMGGGYPI